jgi:RNA polymerase sigma-70 factor, ECF subfamily
MDAVLAARLAAGDDHALAEVFDALAHSVYGSAVRVLGDNSAAQDVVQDVFVELWTHPDRYDPAADAAHLPHRPGPPPRSGRDPQ